MKRQLQTSLTLLKPNLVPVVGNRQMKQKLYHDKSQVERGFMVKEPVRVRITDRGFMSQSVKWSPGVVLEVCGDQWYLVQMGTVTRRILIFFLGGKVVSRISIFKLGSSF